MNIKITSLKNKSKKVSDFRRNEWGLVHPEHFGGKQDKELWTYRKFMFKAEENGKIVGSLDGNYLAGVMYIDQLIVKSDKRGLGIGKKLMDRAEVLAKKSKIHKMYLFTGVDWKSVKFYEALGYIKEAKINNYYEHKDFWFMSKEIKKKQK